MTVDLSPPDSASANRARELAARVSPGFLLNHSTRTFAWGCIQAAREHISFDGELFYVAAILHDLGLTTEFDGPRCFELESAAAASRFAEDQGWKPERRFALAEAIRLHMQARVVIDDGPESYLLSEATACDVGGKGLEHVEDALRQSVLQQFPRLDFKKQFVALCEDQARRKPGCMIDLFLERGLATRIAEAPFDS
jgi:hypothetical protein